MWKVIGKALGIAVVFTLNFLFWSYVEQTSETADWSKLARFLYMTANVYMLYKTILRDTE